MSRIYIQRQKYSECQLVAVINAAIYFGASEVCDREYDRLVDMVGARYSSAISIERALHYFGLEVVPTPAEYSYAKRCLQAGHPIGLSVRTLSQGNHTILVVEVDDHPQGGKLLAINLHGHDWIAWDELLGMMTPSKNLGSIGGIVEKLSLPPLMYIFESVREKR